MVALDRKVATPSGAACLSCHDIFVASNTAAVRRSRNSQRVDEPTRLAKLISRQAKEAVEADELSSKVIGDHRNTGESWSNTSPNNDGGGGGRGGGRGGGIGSGGGEKNRHTPSPYRLWTAILPDCTNSRSGVLDVVHCCRVGGGGVGSVGGGSAHPSDDRKDNNESGGRGGTRHHCGDCEDVAWYRLRHISQGCDQDYDDNDNDASHTTLSGQRDCGFTPLLPPLLTLLSFSGTVPLICAHP